MRRPSILFVNRVYPPARGATGRMLHDLARGFVREGWHVTILTTGAKNERTRDGGVRVVRIKGSDNPLNVWSYGFIFLRLLWVMMRMPSRDVIVTMTDPPLLVCAGSLIARIKKVHHIHWCQDVYPDLFPALKYRFPDSIMAMMRQVTRKAYQNCTKIIVIGRCMGKYLTAHYAIDPKIMTVIPNWPNRELVNGQATEGFKTVSETLQTVTANDARPNEDQHKHGPKFRVLYAGNIGQAHPMETILDAAEILQQRSPDIEFVFVGEGSGFDDLANKRAQRDLQNLRLLPYQPSGRLKAVMESGDVHLISMTEDAAGLLVPSKLYSALAAHRPVVLVGPIHCEAAKILKDFAAGTVVPQNNAHALAETLEFYRYNGQGWFQAHEGAKLAAQIFLPKSAIQAWIDRAWMVVDPSYKPAETLMNESHRHAAE